MEEEVEKKKSFLNNKKKIRGKALSAYVIVIIAIFMLFTFGIGYYLGKVLNEPKNESKVNNEVVDKVDNTDTVDKQNEKDDQDDQGGEIVQDDRVELDINDETVQKLFNIFRYDKENCFLIGEINTSNSARLQLAYNALQNSDIKTRSCSDLKPVIWNETDRSIAPHYCGNMSDEMAKYYSKDDSAFEKATLSNTTKYVEASTLKNKYYELFSSNFSYTDESFERMEYISDKGIYAYYGCQCGGICGSPEQVINSAYKIGDSLFIESTFDGDNVKYEFKLENVSYKFVHAS